AHGGRDPLGILRDRDALLFEKPPLLGGNRDQLVAATRAPDKALACEEPRRGREVDRIELPAEEPLDRRKHILGVKGGDAGMPAQADLQERLARSEERRVGKECRSRWSP